MLHQIGSEMLASREFVVAQQSNCSRFFDACSWFSGSHRQRQNDQRPLNIRSYLVAIANVPALDSVKIPRDNMWFVVIVRCELLGSQIAHTPDASSIHIKEIRAPVIPTSTNLSRRMTAEEIAEEIKAENEFNPGLGFRLIFITLCIISLTAALNATSLSVALPIITDDLGGNAIEAFWSGTSFLLNLTVFQPTFASLSHIFGRKPVSPLQLLLSTADLDIRLCKLLWHSFRLAHFSPVLHTTSSSC
jgi:hypothetical protein